MQSLHQSIIRILSSFWTYRLLEFNENIEKLTCRESMRCCDIYTFYFSHRFSRRSSVQEFVMLVWFVNPFELGTLCAPWNWFRGRTSLLDEFDLKHYNHAQCSNKYRRWFWQWCTLPTQVSGILFKDKGSNGTILFYPCSKEPVKMIDMIL
jgi:hypothetical protein